MLELSRVSLVNAKGFVPYNLLASFLAEINRVRNELFHGSTNGALDHTDENELPPAQGPKVKVAEKVYAPVKAYPKVRNQG